MNKASYVLPVPTGSIKSKLALYPAFKFSDYFFCDIALSDDFSKEPVIFQKLKVSQPIFIDLDPKLGQICNFLVVSIICEDSTADLASTFVVGLFASDKDELISNCCRFVRNEQDFLVFTKRPQEIHVINLEFLERSDLEIQMNTKELKLQFFKPYHRISVGSEAVVLSKVLGRYIYFFLEKQVGETKILVPAI